MQALAHEEKTVEQAVLSQPQEWLAILSHSLREGEATAAEAAAAARATAAAHAQELEAAEGLATGAKVAAGRERGSSDTRRAMPKSASRSAGPKNSP